jgi:hypothetical protein
MQPGRKRDAVTKKNALATPIRGIRMDPKGSDGPREDAWFFLLTSAREITHLHCVVNGNPEPARDFP